MSERDRARKARTTRMRPDLEETEAARTLREGSENVQPSDQRWGPPAKAPTEPSGTPPHDPSKGHPIPGSE
jgi:hypothetical protein